MSYNPNFQWKRKTITIAVPTSNLPAGYQVKVALSHPTDVPEAQTDFRDLRFETTTGYGLPHWIESYVSNTSAIAWVKLKDAVTAGVGVTVDIYMYYGNPYVSSLSNGINTFDFFDDFSGDLSKWTITAGSIENGRLMFNTGNWNFGTKTKLTFARPLIMEWSSQGTAANMATQEGYSNGTFAVWYNEIGGGVWHKDEADTSLNATITGTFYGTKVTQDTNNHKLKIAVLPTSGYTWYCDDVQKATTATGTHTNNYLQFSMGWQTGQKNYIDDVRIRKYVATEPATPTFSGLTTVNWNPQRKPILITGTTPADYQIKLTVTHAMEMNVDYSDLRFVSSNNTALSYWIESYTSNEATVWVKIPAITTSGYVYMHYGNPNLTSTSNGTNTFVTFADFEETGTPTGWGTVSGTPNYDSTTHVFSGAHALTATVDGAVTRPSDNGTGVVLKEVWFYQSSMTYSLVFFDSDGERVMVNHGGAPNKLTLMAGSLYTYYYGTVDVPVGSWFKLTYIRDFTNLKASVYMYTTSGTLLDSIVNKTMLSSNDLKQMQIKTTQWIDVYRVRKYVTTEPTIDQTAATEVMNTFSHRKAITINNSSGGALADYQVPITVTQTSFIQTDFDDIRFVDSSGNLLPYWIESITGTTPNQTAKVWIKVNLSTGNNTVYMYYGNANLTSTSNGANTFEFFDDFSTDRTSEYTKSGLSTWNISGGELTLTAGGGEMWVYPTQLNIRDAVGQADIKYVSGSWVKFQGRHLSTDSAYHIMGLSAMYRVYKSVNATYTQLTPDRTVNLSNYNTVVLKLYGVNPTNVSAQWGTADNVQTTTDSQSELQTTGSFGFGGYSSAVIKVKNFRVRKYVANESTAITVSTGLEQTPAGVTADSMTISKSENPCRTGFCTVTVDVVWRNDSAVPESFIPSIKINTVPVVVDPPLTSVTVDPSGTKSQQFIIPNLPANTYSICPDPN